MQESWKFDIPQEKLTEKPEIGLRTLVQSRAKEMGIFLSYYTRSEGAVVEQVQIKGPIQFESTHRGKFEVSFVKIFFNACLNIHVDQEEMMALSFAWEPEKALLTLNGPLIPEREPDEL
ncbi:hypothetical protein [Pararhodonellum marinum]|uniref:hypothetical protein n=1 Tax=Pararhodonellum marinum TaxID=2755358 RepID=UPI00188FF6A4|nr:hypothetical protein [Pararhodonellum marinum]